jgi:hypothetical protein
VEPRFLDHAEQEERAELVGDFIAVVATIVATMNMEDILRGGGQGP